MTDYLHALPSGYRIEEYELVRVLGSGGFGITYLGYDHHLDKAVAIKEYLPNDLAVRGDNQSVLPKSTEDTPDYEWGLERFLNEAQTLARFDHRHIIKVHRFFRVHGTGYIVMEYAEGETLSELLQRKGSLTDAELKHILLPILDGLEAVHGADFLHRDIKPKNIVIRDDGSPVLIDFGSARQLVVGKSRSVTAIVTPGYAPIEQYSAKGHQGPWTDIYALGAVCYRCLAGEPPDDATERLREDPLIPATRRCKGKASKAFLEAIDRALRVDEGKRPQTVKSWRATLGKVTAEPSQPPGIDRLRKTAKQGNAKTPKSRNFSQFELLLLQSKNELGTSVLLMLAWIAVSDGSIDKSETGQIAEISAALKHDHDLQPLLELAEKRDKNALQLASEIVREHFYGEKAHLFLEMAIGISIADGYLRPTENHIVRYLSDLLGITRAGLNKLFVEVTGREIPKPSNPSSARYWQDRGKQKSSQPGPSQDQHQTSPQNERILKAYALLGLEYGATRKEIDNAYYRLVQVHHPDRFSSLGEEAVAAATSTFRRIKEAYDYLVMHA